MSGRLGIALLLVGLTVGSLTVALGDVPSFIGPSDDPPEYEPVFGPQIIEDVLALERRAEQEKEWCFSCSYGVTSTLAEVCVCGTDDCRYRDDGLNKSHCGSCELPKCPSAPSPSIAAPVTMGTCLEVTVRCGPGPVECTVTQVRHLGCGMTGARSSISTAEQRRADARLRAARARERLQRMRGEAAAVRLRQRGSEQ
jgi:hypothetical protein